MQTFQDRMCERAVLVFSFVEGFLDRLPLSDAYRDLLRVPLDTGRSLVAANPAQSWIHFPLLVHEAITGDGEPALPLAGACMILYLGADLLDNLADDELSPSWGNRPAAQITLGTCTFLSALCSLVLAELEQRGIPSARLCALHRYFSHHLLIMGDGQFADFTRTDDDNLSLEQCRTIIENKCAELSLFAAAGALAAIEDSKIIETYAQFGLAYGGALSIAADLADLWNPKGSHDLANGKRTLPIVHALSSLSGEARDQFRIDLLNVRTDPTRQEAIRNTLTQNGSVTYALLIQEIYRQRALGHLRDATPREPAGNELRAWIDDLRFSSEGIA